MHYKPPVIMLALAALACASGVHVQTQSPPDVTITGRNSFALLPVPRPADSATLAPSDPMTAGSAASLALREELREALQSRGYRPVQGAGPDLNVAVYAAATQPLDPRRFDYGYASPPPAAYQRGSVIVDLVDPASHRLLWRGEAVARTSDDPNRQLADMESVIDAIMSKLPRAIP